MSKILGGISKLATVVASVARFIPGGQTVAGIASAVALVSGTLSAVTAKKPSAPGVTNQFTLNPQAGIPYAIGRTFVGGNVVHVDSYGGTKNPYRSMVIVFSGGGPIDGFEGFYCDRTLTAFSGGAASGYYAGFMNLATQLGASPESAALSAPYAGFPNWGASSKLSGYAAGLWTLKFDKDGKVFASGQPEFGAVGRWVKVYDPRLDSTVPGGSGSCRATVESTYIYSENPWLHGLTWALGRWQNSKRVLGVGIAASDIDLRAWMDAANVADANTWKAGGLIDGSGDKWNNLKLFAQAGGGEPLDLGGLLSCRVDAPRTSLATITTADLADGQMPVPAMKTQRARINGIIPRYRSEPNNWEIIPGTVVRSSTYLSEDGEERTRESEYFLCQQSTQAAQLAGYEIANGREIEGISIPLKPRWIGYKPGDCVTVNIPEAGLINQPVIIMRRALDPETCIVTFVVRTETAAKHAWALGRTTTAPPSAAITAPSVLDDMAASAFRATTTVSATAPTAPAEGDFWVDTSGTYAVFKARSGGAWIVSANALLAYNALTGKPVALADINTTESAKLTGIEAGADVTANADPRIVGNLTWGLDADVAGTITSALPQPRRFSTFKGTTDVSTTCAVSITTTGGVSATIDNTSGGADRGVITLGTGTTSGGTITLTSTLTSGAIVKVVIDVQVTRGAAGSSGSAGATFAQDTTLTPFSTTSHVAVAGELICRSDASAHVRVAFDASYTAAANVAAKAKVAYATTSGGGLTDLMSEVSGSTYILNDEPGSVDIAEATYTMPAANTDYYFKGLMRRNSGSGTVTPTGTLTVRQ